MLPESFVCWKWRQHGYRHQFTVEHVNTLRRMLLKHYGTAMRLICVTDDAIGLDPQVEALPLFGDFEDLSSPHGNLWPSCYRRLRAFHPDAAQWFGSRFVSVDLDVVVLRDLTPLLERDEDFVGWQDPYRPQQLCGSMYMLTAGSRAHVWQSFEPTRSPALAQRLGYLGSDQAWMSYCLQGAARWNRKSGVASFRVDLREGRQPPLPDDRIVMFHGACKPWQEQCRRLPWVRENYV